MKHQDEIGTEKNQNHNLPFTKPIPSHFDIRSYSTTLKNETSLLRFCYQLTKFMFTYYVIHDEQAGHNDVVN